MSATADDRVVHGPHRERTTAPLVPFSYSPPIETICTSCGGKHVGPCPMNACRRPS